MKLSKEILKGSIILLVAFGLFNLFNFLFNIVFMPRFLSLEDYGTLITLLSISLIVGFISEPIQTILAKYSSAEKDNSKLKSIFNKSTRKIFRLSTYVLIGFLLFSIFLSPLLKINYSILALTGLLLFFSIVPSVNLGILQGRKMFRSFGFNIFLVGLLKLFLGIVLVLIGWGVYGAIGAAVLGTLFAFAVSFLQLSKIIKSKAKQVKTPGIYSYARPVFLLTSTIILFYNLDLIIAKSVFSPETAGAYALASTFAKIIFWSTQPISKVLFPISSENQTKLEDSTKAMISSFLILGTIVAILLSLFYFFPDYIIKIFSGRSVPEASSVLFYIAIATSLLAFANLNILYKLSINSFSGYKYLFIFVILEVALLIYFSGSLIEFSFAFITSSAVFLWGSIFLLKNRAQQSLK
jgi:O-antigen/teichoic acid export membrane protein